MKKIRSGIVTVILIIVLSSFFVDDIDDLKALIFQDGKSEQQNSEDIEEVTINRVIDGDTVEVKMPDGEKESVRLLLMDTPESVHPNKPKQPYGDKSSEYAEKKLPEGKKVKLEYDGPKRGTYDRLLAYVWVDGENFNKKMLEKGYARYAYEYDPPYKYQDEFQVAEREAEKENKRIWSIDGFPESEFEDW